MVKNYRSIGTLGSYQTYLAVVDVALYDRSDDGLPL